jgi:cytochrome c oxidase subunit 2
LLPIGVTVRRFAPLIALLLLVVLVTACTTPQSTIAPKSDNAERIQTIYQLTFWLGTLVFVGVLAAALFFGFRFREQPGRVARQIHGNTRLEIVWTIIPVVVLAIIAVPTFNTVAHLTGDAPEGSLEVRATGHQWWFEFEYPEFGFITANEMHIPLGRPVSVALLSTDVIHAFWVPQLHGKIDMVPGHENHLWFTPEQPGTYLAQCAEFCGASHANMRFRVVVDTPEDFEAWVQNQQSDAAEPEEELAQQGRDIFLSSACIGCHTIRGTDAAARAGPELTHFAERDIVAAFLPNTDENLALWLADPPAVKPGALMPDLGLSTEQIQALVAYLQSLE